MLQTTRNIHEIVNPEGKKLTHAQWQKKIRDYEEKEAAKRTESVETNELRPGVCECGCSDFHLRALKGGVIERICKNEDCKQKILL